MEIKVEITADGKAKEVNPFEGQNESHAMAFCVDECTELCGAGAGCLKWRKAESARKTYEIETKCLSPCEVISLCECLKKYKIGSQYNSIIINETTVRIVD